MTRGLGRGRKRGDERVAAAGNGGLFAAQLIRARALCAFFRALCLHGFAQGGDFTFKALEFIGRGLKAQACLSALDAEVLLFVAGLAHLRMEPLRFALEGSQALFALRGKVSGVASQGEKVHGVAAPRLQLPLGVEDLFRSRAGRSEGRFYLLPRSEEHTS